MSLRSAAITLVATAATVAALTACSSTKPSTSTSSVVVGGSGVGFGVDGTYKGQPVKGTVQSGTLMCIPITTGGKQGLQLTWGGTVSGTGQISGDVMFPGGFTAITFGGSAPGE